MITDERRGMITEERPALPTDVYLLGIARTRRLALVVLAFTIVAALCFLILGARGALARTGDRIRSPESSMTTIIEGTRAPELP